jgi:hypothetical protein
MAAQHLLKLCNPKFLGKAQWQEKNKLKRKYNLFLVAAA